MQRLNPRAGTELHTSHTKVKLFQDWGWWPRGSGVQQRAAAAAAWGLWLAEACVSRKLVLWRGARMGRWWSGVGGD